MQGMVGTKLASLLLVCGVALSWCALPARADGYCDCHGNPISEEEYLDLLDYFAFLDAEVFGPVFGPSSPPADCNDVLALSIEAHGAGDVLFGVRFASDEPYPFTLTLLEYEVLVDPAYLDQFPDLPPEWQNLKDLGFVYSFVYAWMEAEQGAVPVAGYLVSLDVLPPEPDEQIACVLPSGQCELTYPDDCQSQGGTVLPFMCVGDHDGDGIDDAATFDPYRRTFLIPALVADEDEVALLVERWSEGSGIVPGGDGGGGEGGNEGGRFAGVDDCRENCDRERDECKTVAKGVHINCSAWVAGKLAGCLVSCPPAPGWKNALCIAACNTGAGAAQRGCDANYLIGLAGCELRWTACMDFCDDLESIERYGHPVGPANPMYP